MGNHWVPTAQVKGPNVTKALSAVPGDDRTRQVLQWLPHAHDRIAGADGLDVRLVSDDAVRSLATAGLTGIDDLVEQTLVVAALRTPIAFWRSALPAGGGTAAQFVDAPPGSRSRAASVSCAARACSSVRVKRCLVVGVRRCS